MKRYLLLLILLSACATPTTIMRSSSGNEVTCGGGTAGSIAGGLVGYTIQEGHDQDCVKHYAQKGYKIITPDNQ